MRRVAAKFVPKLLNCDQKQHRMNIANEMLDSVRDDPNLFQRVITVATLLGIYLCLLPVVFALPHPEHLASSQPVRIACGSRDLSLAHRYWSCSAVRLVIREVISIIGRLPDLQSWIFPVDLEDHAITISSPAKHAIYVFFVDSEIRGVAGDLLAILHQTLQRWQRSHIHCT
ncbi:hypothetical protein LAZ67_20001879 [Cordylochernes scorpioides]|uniref:Uncharacterized protein n=1 Tax=Cordylochernes scorpioides TaxID=51811 RepID=A0ABY6LLC0_9ARAC|nr:hypothetical protein LAZ67_20001879 [Cordylochernes scorpioides]